MTATGWTGFASDVLEAVEAAINEERQSLGLAHVRIGERKKDWGNPACFIYLPSTEAGSPSERHGTEDKNLRVMIMVITKTMNTSDDLRVWKILEGIANVLDENVSLAGTRDHVYGDMEVAPDNLSDGSYETVGLLPVVYRKALCREIR